MAYEIDPEVRIENIVSFANTFIKPMIPNLVTLDSISSGDTVSNSAFVAIVFVAHSYVVLMIVVHLRLMWF